MKFASAVLTCPRPNESTLLRTLHSLESGGFNNYEVYQGITGKGHFIPWRTALRRLVERVEADYYALFEDDVVVCRGLREYLEASVPIHESPASIFSPYTPGPYSKRVGASEKWTWRPFNLGWYLVSTQAWCVEASAAKRIIQEIADTGYPADAVVGKWAKENGVNVLFHVPSLVQHIAPCNSALGNKGTGGREACDFVGEEFDAASRLGVG